MAEFLIYTKNTCVYCSATKQWLVQRGHTFVERNIEQDQAVLVEYRARMPQARTVPQIFLNGYQIGGYEDLIDADQKGTLKMLLEMENPS